MTFYNVAVIGTGNIAKTHLKFLKKIKRFKVVGVYGRDYLRVKEISSQFDIKAFKDFNDILTDDNIQGVDIATSSDLHAEYGIKAAQYHKNIIVEKPIDFSISQAEELVKTCKQNHCLLGVIFQHRFDEITHLLKKLINNEIFGKLISGKIEHSPKRNIYYYLNQEGYPNNKCKGVLINNGIHYIDLSLFLFGEVAGFKGIIRQTRQEVNVDDYANIFMEFKSGFLLNLEFKTNLKKSLPTIIEINGENGSIIFEGNTVRFISLDIPFKSIYTSKDFLKLYLIKKFKLFNEFRSGSHYDVFCNYLSALEKKEKVCVDGNEGLVSLAVVDKIYRQNYGIG
jgi:predicted dehydrogenase